VAGHAVLWKKGKIIDLGSVQGGPLSTTFTNPNERGDVSGMSNTPTPDPNGEDFCFFFTFLICRGFVWQDGAIIPMPTLGGNNSLAYQINNRGQVVGVAETPMTESTCPAWASVLASLGYGGPASYFEAKPVIWQKGSLQELPTISGDPDGVGYGINDRGQIVGSTGACNQAFPYSGLHAVLWPNGPNGGVIDLGNLGATTLNVAFDINNRGQVVGQAGTKCVHSGGCGLATDAAFHAFLWQGGVMTDLGTLPGDLNSWANNVNSKGQIVGTSFPETGSRAFIWENGVMTDLNTLVSGASGFYLAEAFGINDHGQISGFGLLPGVQCGSQDVFCNQRAYLLDPCDVGDKSCADSSDATTTAPPGQKVNSPWSVFMQRYHRPGPLSAPRD
jgi:probable HAF family extracellular repeat protein